MVTSGGGQGGLVLPRWYWALYGAVLLVIGSVVASSDWLDSPNRATQPAWPFVVDELTSLGLILALTPMLFRVALRLDPRRIGWIRTIAGHLAWVSAFCASHVAGMILLRKALYPLFGASYLPAQDWLVDVVLYESRKDLLTYAALVGLGWLLAASLRKPAAGALPSEPPAGPVRLPHRDGAVIGWIAASDILWIEAAGNYVELVLAERTVLQRQTLHGMERLLGGAGFVRIHRSRLVNPAMVRSIVNKESGDFIVELADGREVMGSRRFRPSVDVLAGRPVRRAAGTGSPDGS